MMAVVNCRQCGQKIGTQAEYCPSCGMPRNAESGCFGFGCSGIVLLGIVGFYCFSAIQPKPATKNDERPSAPSTQSTPKQEPANASVTNPPRKPEPSPQQPAFKTDSPDVVGRYLQNDGLQTRDYLAVFPPEYAASSDYKAIGSNTPFCNLAYSIEGSKDSISRVMLVLNVNNPLDRPQARAEFSAQSERLAVRAIGEKPPKIVSEAIAAETTGEWRIADITFKVERIDFTGTVNGYSLKFQIE